MAKTTPKKTKKQPSKKPAGPMDVSSIKHADKRKNIPTQELKDFVKDDDGRKVTLYPRNTDLDPQLVWRGKDEQDAAPLEVPAVPIYIQEKIHAKAIIEDFRKDADRDPGNDDDDFGGLFHDFNGLPEEFDKRVTFYEYDANWSNRLILGDSLLAMNSLAEKEGLKGRVQMVYFDPPYGIKFGSNWQTSTRSRDVKDGKAEDATRQPEQIKAFRDTWKDGLHTYLAYLRDRLVAAHGLLTETGCIFLQIGLENVHVVRCVLDEVFGSDNCIAQIPFAKTSGSTGDFLPGTADYLLFYAKDRGRLKFRAPLVLKDASRIGEGPYSWLELQNGTQRRMLPEEKSGASPLPCGSRVFRFDNLQSQSIGRQKGEGAASWFPVLLFGKEWKPSPRSRWKTNESGMLHLRQASRLAATRSGLYYKRYFDDFLAQAVGDNWTDTVVAGFASDKQYVACPHFLYQSL